MKLVLTELPEEGQTLRLVAALREQMRILRDDPTLSGSLVVSGLEKGLPLLIGQGSDSDALQAAQEALAAIGATTELLDDDIEVDSDESEAEGSPGVDPAAGLALAAMAFADGNAGIALSYLATLDHIDPDGPHAEAAHLLLAAFPPNHQQVAVARMIAEHFEVSDDEHLA